MPAGFTRLNERKQRPNENIAFIKPLESADKAIAQDFLDRIAAICAPIMKANHLVVTSLEEFPPNREFWGRNFNAGEAIQLVLKSPTNGRWLPFRFVQMVMMHELAHCQQMNHSRAFWKVRNQFAGELKELWSKDYTGDGLWGRGQALYGGQYVQDTMPAEEDSPEHLCGGVYRSGHGRKRGRNGAAELSYAEKKQRRIEKKFGKNGMSLGADDDTKVKLEKGKKVKGKPRVAGSVRGRELRAAAALARFEKPIKQDEVKTEDSETESDDDYDEPAIKIEAVDGDGQKILDGKGNSFFKVCGDEDVENDEGAQDEMKELGSFSRPSRGMKPPARESAIPRSKTAKAPAVRGDDEDTASEAEEVLPIKAATATQKQVIKIEDDEENHVSRRAIVTNKEPVIVAGDDEDTASEADEKVDARKIMSSTTKEAAQPAHVTANRAMIDATETRETSGNVARSPQPTAVAAVPGICRICSLENGKDDLTCAACGHVLDTSKLRNFWACTNSSCKDLGYMNVGDNGICGLCGTARGS